MSTLIAGDSHAVFASLEKAYERLSTEDHLVMVVTFSNACPVP